jgi:hypothetical protein
VELPWVGSLLITPLERMLGHQGLLVIREAADPADDVVDRVLAAGKLAPGGALAPPTRARGPPPPAAALEFNAGGVTRTVTPGVM